MINTKREKIVIVGGVAGGAGVATRLRRLSEKNEIIMFEKTPYISYANCGLPYYLGGVIQDRNKLLVQTVENLSKRFNLDIRVNSEVIKINKIDKYIIVKNLETNEEYKESYDKLVLSPGAKAIIPPIKNIEVVSNIFTLKTIPDTDDIYNYIYENKVKNVIVIGAGFIGVEVAENLREKGLKVTLIDNSNQILQANSDFEMAQVLHSELKNKKINLILNDLVMEISKDGKKIKTKKGKNIDVDMIILSVGIKPQSELALECDLEMDEKTNTIKVNNNFKTSDDSIYAVGDVIAQYNKRLDEEKLVPLAWGANRQSRQLADVLSGLHIKRDNIKGASVIKVFNKTFASVGITEKLARLKMLDYDVIYINRNNHAGYYPNATPIILKLLFEKLTGEILGAQAVGNEGVEKRIDIISTAMQFGATVKDLSSIEVCYAPPYNSAKDPINIAGYIAENILNNTYKTVQYYEIDELVDKGAYLLDVRTPFEYDTNSIEGSVNIELDSLRDNLDKLPKDKNTKIYVTCKIGHRAYLAIQILKNNGYKNIYNLTGGMDIYTLANSKE